MPVSPHSVPSFRLNQDALNRKTRPCGDVFTISASNKETSATTWILLIVEPSLSAMKIIFLLPRFVLTQP
jgi:hypothetical protein